jgi:phage tail sheath protein FI
MPEYLSPGVFVEEFAIGPKPVEGVSTSTAGFIGIAEKGPLNKPELVTSMSEFRDKFGNYYARSYLAYAVAGFFENGGKRCFVTRIAGPDAKAASTIITSRDSNTVLTIKSISVGDWGNNVTVAINDSSSGSSALYHSKIKELSNNTFKPEIVEGLSVGDIVKITDGLNNLTVQLKVLIINDDIVTFEPAITAASLKTGVLHVFSVIPANQSGNSYAKLKNVIGFENGDLVNFITASPSLSPAQALISNVRAIDKKIELKELTRDIESYSFITAKRNKKEYNNASMTKTDKTLTLIGIDNDEIWDLLDVDDIIELGSDKNKEKGIICGKPDKTKKQIILVSALINDHSGETQFTIFTQSRSNVFSVKINKDLKTGDEYDLNCNNFRKDDMFVDGAKKEFTVVSVKGNIVTFNKEITKDTTLTFKTINVTVLAGNLPNVKDGDYIEISDSNKKEVAIVKSVSGNRIEFKEKVGIDSSDVTFTIKEWKETVAKTVDFGLNVTYEKGKEVIEERFDKLSLNKNSNKFIEKAVNVNSVSKLIQVEVDNKSTSYSFTSLPELDCNKPLVNGSDDLEHITISEFIGVDKGKGERTGLTAFEAVDEVNILCIPDLMTLDNKDAISGLQGKMISHCERLKDRFAILDSLRNYDITEIQSWKIDHFDSQYAALYYPWIKVLDPIQVDGNTTRLIPPCGHVAGIYARSDIERGVHKAPANEVINGVTELEFDITSGQQDILNPSGINCLRKLPGRGIRVWGSRTMSSDPLWKYVNVRRLFIYLEESINKATQWVVFEPNDIPLWARVRQTIDQFLTDTWQSGMLAGANPGQAFFVKCDRTTMSQNDIDNGRLICVIGVAPVKPAEFVIFRLAQWTLGAK